MRVQETGVPTVDDGSIALVARLIKNEAGGSLRLDVDGAFLIPGTSSIFADGFERRVIFGDSFESATTPYW